MFGFLNVNKPPGPTSHDVVDQVRRVVGRGVRVGHAGTLDPFAGGVLVLCVGPATRLASYVQAQPKRYRAEIHLGARSTTDDPEGEITQAPGATAPAEEAVRLALETFVGQISQVPPAHSAVHVEGQRAYKLARAGREVALPSRQVRVYSIDLLEYRYPRLGIEVACGAGTYVRALARDIGQALGVGGYCAALQRTAVGPFLLASAVSPDRIDSARDLLPPLMGLEALPKVSLSGSDLARLLHGGEVSLPERLDAAEAAVVDERGQLVAIGSLRSDGNSIRPKAVFGQV